MGQRLTILVPPTLDELLASSIYRAYVTRNPRLPDNLKRGEPWQIMANRRKHKPDRPDWEIAFFATYADALARVNKLRAKGKYRDIAIISRRKYFGPPKGFEWDLRFHWCGRCRRPSLFRINDADNARHGAMIAAVFEHQRNGYVAPTHIISDVRRCYYCAMPQASMPHYRAWG